jgi:hypothetical protein
MILQTTKQITIALASSALLLGCSSDSSDDKPAKQTAPSTIEQDTDENKDKPTEPNAETPIDEKISTPDTDTTSDNSSKTEDITTPQETTDTTKVDSTEDNSTSIIETDTNTTTEVTSSLTETLGYTDIELRTSKTLSADFYTPAAMVELLSKSKSVTWTQSSSTPAHLQRFAFGEATSSDVFTVSDTGGNISATLSITADLATKSTGSNDALLRTMFQFVKINTTDSSDTKLAIFSAKHANYALDLADDGVSLILRDVRGLEAFNSGSATKVLTFSMGTSPSTLVANGHYVLNLETSTATNTLVYDALTWENKNVSLSDGNLVLGSSVTSIKLYDAPIGLDIPSDFNPDEVAYVSNDEVYLTSTYEGDNFANGIKDLGAKFAAQVSAKRSNTATLAAVNTKLDEIEAALASQKSQMRYPREFYLAFREGLFDRVLQSAESVDAVIGTLTVPYVYFTNAQDTSGNYHPFMVIATHGLPDTLANLLDVPHPPGDGLSGQYEDQKITRSFYMENFLLKIPMRDYGEVSKVTENDLTAISSLADDVKEANYDHHNYASVGSSAVAIDGVVVYPSYNRHLAKLTQW